ncbi:hypothetical protein ACS0TY_011235 [Phlomoides rotata]
MNFGLLVRARDCIPVNCTRNPSTKRGCRTKKLNSFGNDQVYDELYRFTQVVMGYVLETVAYILNLVPSKSVPKNPFRIVDLAKTQSETHKDMGVSSLRVG